jgi:predicted HTH transcriptional regulator
MEIVPKNPILAKMFGMVKLAANSGVGLENIEHNWKEFNGTSVDYDIDLILLL